ncbi:MAG: DedA family protein [Hyphomicrobiaceae bacterium]|nr:DedA family protein [Hyphomicrobiaceae bacterium]
MLATIDSFKQAVISVVSEHIALAEPLVFVLGFAESIVFVSLLVPSTILFLAIGGLHYSAGGDFVPLWLAGAAGAFLGDILSYSVGRYFKAELANTWPLSRKPEWFVLARSFFHKWGALGIILSKFLGMMRPFVPLVAGAAQMPWTTFLPASAVSALLWAAAFLGPGHGLALF